MTRTYALDSGTTAQPVILQMLQDFWRDARALDPLVCFEYSVVLVGPREAARVGRSREVREYVCYRSASLNGDRSDLTPYGVPSTLYGHEFKLNPSQPEGQVDFVWGSHILTALDV